MKYEIIKNSDNQNEIQSELTSRIWPEFMHHDKIVNKYWKYLFSYFLKFQIAYVFDSITIAVVNSIPLNWDKGFNLLPDEGLDWALEKAVTDYNKNYAPNLLVGLQIAINKDFQGQGLSTVLLKSIKNIAKEQNINKIVIPVRPTSKSDYPLIPIEDYITWKNPNNLPFDPWIRVHVRNRGEIIKVCKKSMQIEGKVHEWENWTNQNYPGDGNYIVTGALTPISIDIKKNIGKYIEPNVWILHKA